MSYSFAHLVGYPDNLMEAADDPLTSQEDLFLMATTLSSDVAIRVLLSPQAGPELIARLTSWALAQDAIERSGFLAAIARNPASPPGVLVSILDSDPISRVAQFVLENKNLPSSRLQEYYDSRIRPKLGADFFNGEDDSGVHNLVVAVCSNPASPPGLLAEISALPLQSGYNVFYALCSNPSTPQSVLSYLGTLHPTASFDGAHFVSVHAPYISDEVASDLLEARGPLFAESLANSPALPPLAALALASSDISVVRMCVASSARLTPEAAGVLLLDTEPEVLRRLACNPLTPVAILTELASDDDYLVSLCARSHVALDVDVSDILNVEYRVDILSQLASHGALAPRVARQLLVRPTAEVVEALGISARGRRDVDTLVSCAALGPARFGVMTRGFDGLVSCLSEEFGLSSRRALVAASVLAFSKADASVKDVVASVSSLNGFLWRLYDVLAAREPWVFRSDVVEAFVGLVAAHNSFTPSFSPVQWEFAATTLKSGAQLSDAVALASEVGAPRQGSSRSF